MLHLLLHFIVPALVVRPLFARHFDRAWLVAYGVLMLTMVVDLDHLLATPVYDPLRCSMGFHPLHSFVPVLLYLAMAMWKRTRLAGVGLLIHMALDSVDCLTMPGGAEALQNFLPG